AFGVGTEMITSRDAPALSVVYKLVALNGAGRFKLSPGKKTYPLGKQGFRLPDGLGRFAGDHLAAAHETCDGEALPAPVILAGALAAPLPTLDAIRAHCRRQLTALPDALRGVNPSPSYPLSYSDTLEREAERLGVK